MDAPESVASDYGRARVCPHCGARVAQRAESCLYCGGLLNDAPRRRPRAFPWPDLILFLFISVVVALWWFHTPTQPSAAETTSASPTTPTWPAPAVFPRLSPTVPTVTPMPTLTPTPTLTPAPTPIRHKIAAGESLALIADKYGSTAKEIAEANGMTVNDMIYPGQELVIPPSKAGDAPRPTPTPTGGTLLYTVQAGDTLSGIAAEFDSRLEWILEANKRRLDDILRPGDRLLIPLSNRTPTPTFSPTPTLTPTPTPTSDIVLRPPILLAPPHEATIAGNEDVLLRWASSGVLAKDQWYVVMVQVIGTDALVTPQWTKNTQWRLPGAYRDAGATTTRFAWQVQVFAGAPGDPAARPVSPPSEIRVFSWTRSP